MSRDHPRFRAGSIIGTGPRHALDREQRAVWRARLHIARRADRITALQAEVGRALLHRLGQDGQCDPSHATLAGDAGCSESTVLRALRALAECGMVQWTRRLIRAGWRAAQTSNAYCLLTPSGLAFARACDRQPDRGINQRVFKTATARPSSGTDEWARGNAARQIAALLAGG